MNEIFRISVELQDSKDLLSYQAEFASSFNDLFLAENINLWLPD